MTKNITYFEIDKLILTPGIQELLRTKGASIYYLHSILERHILNESELDQEDKETNYNSWLKGGMFLSRFNFLDEKIYIVSYIQEPNHIRADRKAEQTTIMLASEY